MKLFHTLLFCAAMLFAGCQTTVAPGADPVVVHAEQTLALARHALDAFVQYDHTHRAAVPKEVHAFAESVRREAPPKFRAALALLDAYHSNRSPENRATLETYVAALAALAAQADASH